MAVLVTGGAGFVAATLIRRLLAAGENVIAIDKRHRGTLDTIKPGSDSPELTFVETDLSDLPALRHALSGPSKRMPVTEVWHMAANSDIAAGGCDPDIDLRDTFLTTFNTLKVMEEFAIGNIFFASSSAIYGDLPDVVLTEETGPLLPISNYGAMKLASEAVISAACERFLQRALLFRFPNVVGVPATHGVILDFIKRLQANPRELQVLGNGEQQKAYLHVSDLVDAMLFLRKSRTQKLDIFNIGSGDEGITVREIAEQVVAAVSPAAGLRFQASKKGWPGDVPKFRYSTAKLERLGWKPKLNSAAAVGRAIEEIAEQVMCAASPA